MNQETSTRRSPKGAAFPSPGLWPTILASPETRFKVLGLVVLVAGALLVLVLPMAGEKAQVPLILGTFVVLLAVVGAVAIRSTREGEPGPAEIPSIWSKDDLPISEKEKRCWLGKWNCRWTYRSLDGELHRYADDVVTIEDADGLPGVGPSSSVDRVPDLGELVAW